MEDEQLKGQMNIFEFLNEPKKVRVDESMLKFHVEWVKGEDKAHLAVLDDRLYVKDFKKESVIYKPNNDIHTTYHKWFETLREGATQVDPPEEINERYEK